MRLYIVRANYSKSIACHRICGISIHFASDRSFQDLAYLLLLLVFRRVPEPGVLPIVLGGALVALLRGVTWAAGR